MWKEVWERLKKPKMEDLDNCIKKMWKCCCGLGVALLIMGRMVLDISRFYYDFAFVEQLQKVHINLFDIHFITDQSEHIFKNYLTRGMLVLLIAGVVLCGICMVIGAKTEDEAKKVSNKEDEEKKSE